MNNHDPFFEKEYIISQSKITFSFLKSGKATQHHSNQAHMIFYERYQWSTFSEAPTLPELVQDQLKRKELEQ